MPPGMDLERPFKPWAFVILLFGAFLVPRFPLVVSPHSEARAGKSSGGRTCFDVLLDFLMVENLLAMASNLVALLFGLSDGTFCESAALLSIFLGHSAQTRIIEPNTGSTFR